MAQAAPGEEVIVDGHAHAQEMIVVDQSAQTSDLNPIDQDHQDDSTPVEPVSSGDGVRNNNGLGSKEGESLTHHTDTRERVIPPNVEKPYEHDRPAQTNHG